MIFMSEDSNAKDRFKSTERQEKMDVTNFMVYGKDCHKKGYFL